MKKLKKALSVVLAFAMSLSLAACKRDEGEKVDKNRTQVFVNFYNGGLGSAWLTELKKSFEAIHPEIQIMPLPGKSTMDSGTVLNNFDAYDGDLFFMDYVGSSDLREFISRGYIADTTKWVKEQKLTEFDGGNSTIWDKITPAVKDYYDVEGKTYALPGYQASYQLIYDVALFEEKSLYKDANGQWNNGSAKSVGQDGVPGTFDDGLPVTYSDFFDLLDRMVSLNLIPVTFYGSNAYTFTAYLTNMFADYEGYNDFMLNYTLNGTDSDFGEIDLEDGYKLKNGQSGKKYVLEFAKDLMAKSAYYSENVFQTSQDNFAAQDEFLYGVEFSKKSGKRIAMLVDGPWWEREASETMKEMAADYSNQSYAYGKREFGIMPMPEADDGSSAEGNTVACTSGCSLIFMNNRSKSKDAAGLFLQYCMSDEGLRIATAASGIMRPYNYTMTDEYLEKMTPFGRATYSYNSGARVVFEEVPIHQFLRTEGAAYCSYLFSMVSSEDTTANIAQYFLPGKTGHTVKKYLEGMAINQSEWTDAVEAYRFRTEV